MRLGDFILENMESILAAWEDHARRHWVGPIPDSARLRDDAEAMLRAVVKDMASTQTANEKKSKSRGEYEGADTEMNRTAVEHTLSRVNDGFDIERMVAEFRALRASVNMIWWDRIPAPQKEQIDDMTRFNEAIDQLVAASLTGFTERVERSRSLFFGMLIHDLRQPLNSLSLFTEILAEKYGKQIPDAGKLLSHMAASCASMSAMMRDLLDLTSSQLGGAMPMNPSPASMEDICREVVEEFEAAAPQKTFVLETAGDLEGRWDPVRLRQMISNLLSNAVQYGATGEPVRVTLRGSADDVTLAVHNTGVPIPREALDTLFDPMVHLASKDEKRPQGSMGLGLYICRQIAVAHRGEIKVESSAEKGTTFTVRLPKRAVPEESGSR